MWVCVGAVFHYYVTLPHFLCHLSSTAEIQNLVLQEVSEKIHGDTWQDGLFWFYLQNVLFVIELITLLVYVDDVAAEQ